MFQQFLYSFNRINRPAVPSVHTNFRKFLKYFLTYVFHRVLVLEVHVNNNNTPVIEALENLNGAFCGIYCPHGVIIAKYFFDSSAASFYSMTGRYITPVLLTVILD